MAGTLDLLNKITEKKRSQAEVLRYLRTVDEKLHHRLRSCASYLLIREWVETGETRLRNANFCKRHQICPACAVRRGARLAENALPRIQSVMAENSHLTPVHVTLTIPNSKNVSEGVERLKMAWKGMIDKRRKALAGTRGHNPIEWCKVEGGIRSVEVTNKGKGWHPHIHALVLVNSFLDREALSREFVAFGGGKIVWANKVGSTEQELVPALLEVLKYPTKFGDLTPAQRYEFYQGTRKSRLTDSFGNLRGVKIGDIDQDDLDLDGAYRDWVARWYHQAQKYRLWRADAWDDTDEAQEEVIPEVD